MIQGKQFQRLELLAGALNPLTPELWAVLEANSGNVQELVVGSWNLWDRPRILEQVTRMNGPFKLSFTLRFSDTLTGHEQSLLQPAMQQNTSLLFLSGFTIEDPIVQGNVSFCLLRNRCAAVESSVRESSRGLWAYVFAHALDSSHDEYSPSLVFGRLRAAPELVGGRGWQRERDE